MWGIHSGLNYWWMAVPLAINGFSFGAFGSANQTQTMMDVPHAHGGTAGGFLQTGQRVATAIGIAMVTAVFFAGQHMGAPEQHWLNGMAFGLGSVIILSSITLVSALFLVRSQRKNLA